MGKRILEVGNCAADHAAICSLIEKQFEAEVVQAHTTDEALSALSDGSFDLVLINRVLDRDQSDGLELIRKIKSHRGLGDVPTMLISNYPEYQQRAVEAGAAPGFGKSELNDPGTLKRLKEILG